MIGIIRKWENGVKSFLKRLRKQLLSPSTNTYIIKLVYRSKYITTHEIYTKYKNIGKYSSIATITKYLKSLAYYNKEEKKFP